MVNLLKTSKKDILNSNYVHGIDLEPVTHSRSLRHNPCSQQVYSSAAERQKEKHETVNNSKLFLYKTIKQSLSQCVT